MHQIAYTVLSCTPCLLFCLLALPVDKSNARQEALLTAVYVCDLLIPVYFAGTNAPAVGLCTGVMAWVVGLKMAVWLFCMPQEERRKRPFYGTLFYWRDREKQPVSQHKMNGAADSAAGSTGEKKRSEVSLARFVWTYLKHETVFSALHIVISSMDRRESIAVFQQATEFLQWRTWSSELTPRAVISSFWLCTLFSVYLQIHMQLTYDVFLIVFGITYNLLPWLRMRNFQQSVVKEYIEQAADMPPAFDSPWASTSLRDYWSNRWHKFYNASFYRLAYRPMRRLCGNVPILRKSLPTWAVFALSGFMHEYYLYCTTGSALYLSGTAGWQMLFFTIQPIGILIGDTFFSSGWPGRLWAIAWMVLMSHLFVVPYLLCDYFDTLVVRISPIMSMAVSRMMGTATGDLFNFLSS